MTFDLPSTATGPANSPSMEGAHHQSPLAVPMPFLRQPIHLGDLVKSLTDALHIPQCGGCRDRQEALNGAVEFRPMRMWED
jgi:hypothetical protein